MSMTVKVILVVGGSIIISAVAALFREVRLMEEADARYPLR